MRKTRLSTLAAALVLTGGLLAGRAAAMPPTPAINGGTSRVEKVAVMCGGMGCAPVQTKQMQHRKFQPLGYTRPIPRTPQPITTLPSKS